MVRQPAAVRDVAHLLLVQFAHREKAAGQRAAVHRVQKIRLVLVAVPAAQQPCRGRRVPQARVMAGGQPLGAQPSRLVQAGSELDAPVAAHVGVGRAPRPALPQHLLEDFPPVLFGEIQVVKRDAEFAGHAGGGLKVLGGGAGAVGLVPVGHVQGFHPVPRVDQAQRGHRGIHSAGNRHHDGAGHAQTSLRQLLRDAGVSRGSQGQQRFTRCIRQLCLS